MFLKICPGNKKVGYVNGQSISKQTLFSADYLVLMSGDLWELQKIITDLKIDSKKIELSITLTKPK